MPDNAPVQIAAQVRRDASTEAHKEFAIRLGGVVLQIDDAEQAEDFHSLIGDSHRHTPEDGFLLQLRISAALTQVQVLLALGVTRPGGPFAGLQDRRRRAQVGEPQDRAGKKQPQNDRET